MSAAVAIGDKPAPILPLHAMSETAMTFQMTDHAVKRAQQRGISRDTIDLISQLADRRCRVPGGATALSISEKARQRWIGGGLPPAEIERAGDVVVIADLGSRSIITVEHTYGQRRRFRR